MLFKTVSCEGEHGPRESGRRGGQVFLLPTSRHDPASAGPAEPAELFESTLPPECEAASLQGSFDIKSS